MVAKRDRRDLERALGFNAGALKAGYSVYALISPIALGEFEWKDRTRYSDGWHFDPTIGEYVQRADELRAALGKQNNWQEDATDRQIKILMEKQRECLNVRSGPNRIVKVSAKQKVASYPDSPFFDVPQWRLTAPKAFVLLR